jgi:hypothetical protein
MSKTQEALRLALEALQTAHLAVEDDMLADEIQQAITAIREALAEQPAQEPVAKVCHDLDGHIGWNPKLTQLPDEGTPLYASQLAQQQEPEKEVTITCSCGDKFYIPLDELIRQLQEDKSQDFPKRFDTHPTPPASKPLTDAQIGAVAADIWGSVLIAPQSYQAFARAIEAAHGIKGDA